MANLKKFMEKKDSISTRSPDRSAISATAAQLGHSAVSARPTPLGFSRDNVVRRSRCMITSCSMGLGKLLLVAVVIFAVTMVFCAPFTYLEPTALRASQAANHLKMALLAAAFTLASLLCLIGFFWLVCRHCPSPLATVDDLVALNCARHC